MVLARATGFAPTLRGVDRLASVADLPLEPAHELTTVLEEGTNGRQLAGSVRVLQEVDNAALVVATGEVQPGVQHPILVAAGTYSIFAEASGYRPAKEEVEVRKPHTHVAIRLEKAGTVRGRVADRAGNGLPGAVVIALSQGVTFESMHNAGMTDGDGQFEVTLPARAPWTLLAKLDGYSGPPMTFSTAPDNVTLILERRCTVSVLPLQAGTTPVATEMVAFMRPQTMEVVVAKERTEDGSFRAQLAPGTWIGVVEELGLQGMLTVPESCGGWRTTLSMVGVEERN